MADERRKAPNVWVSWLTGLLSGDLACRYAAWYRAHFWFEKRRESPEAENRLSLWRGDHAVALQARAEELRQAGWDVRLESQNEFCVHGTAGDMGCKPDLVATMAQADGSLDWRCEDIKTGKPRESDWWQVAIYLLFAPRNRERLPEFRTGAVVYSRQRDQDREVPSEAVPEDVKQRIVDEIRLALAETPPPASPSPRECGMCNIAYCAYRAEPAPAVVVETEAF